jgi:hypothetical protein
MRALAELARAVAPIGLCPSVVPSAREMDRARRLDAGVGLSRGADGRGVSGRITLPAVA